MKKVFLTIAAIYFLFLPACFSSEKSNQDENYRQADEEAFSVPDSDINLAKPLVISQQPKDVALCEQINQKIERSEFSNARWGVIAISLKDGRIVCGRDERKLFNPASIEKTLTAIVALDKLGANFRWKTSVYAAKEIENGVLDGDLVIYGRGAPDFGETDLENLTAQLQAKNIKKINGSVIGDESFFKGDDIGDGWTWNDLQWHYGAEASALTYKENQAEVYINDGKPGASTDYMQVQNQMQPKQTDKPEAFGIKRGLADNDIYIWGNGDKAGGKIAVHNPALWTAKTFKELLEKKGITVVGEAKSIDWKSDNKLNVENTVELASVESKTLAEIVQRMDKRSINLYGELILRTIGKQFGETAPDESRQIQQLRGDDAAGAAVVKKFLRENNVATDEVQIHDGSGLSRLDFVSPEAFGRALIYAAQSKFANEFVNSLPIAGTDGTLGGRLGNVKGKILAKTGTVTFVHSLTGYAQGADNEIIAFAIIGNNLTGRLDKSNMVDMIATQLVDKSSEKDSEKEKQPKEKH